jgi:hypothetical protein
VPGEDHQPQGKTIDLWYAGKTHDFGGNIQGMFYPSGLPMLVSDVLPGNVHDLAAARQNVLAVLRPFLGAMPVLADPGYDGAGHGVHVPVKKPAGAKELDINTRARNALLRSARCLGERGFALWPSAGERSSMSPPAPGKSASSPGGRSSWCYSSTRRLIQKSTIRLASPQVTGLRHGSFE